VTRTADPDRIRVASRGWRFAWTIFNRSYRAARPMH